MLYIKKGIIVRYCYLLQKYNKILILLLYKQYKKSISSKKTRSINHFIMNELKIFNGKADFNEID